MRTSHGSPCQFSTALSHDGNTQLLLWKRKDTCSADNCSFKTLIWTHGTDTKKPQLPLFLVLWPSSATGSTKLAVADNTINQPSPANWADTLQIRKAEQVQNVTSLVGNIRQRIKPPLLTKFWPLDKTANCLVLLTQPTSDKPARRSP